MRWKKRPEEKPGSMRKIKKFAWLPKELDDGYVVWLERFNAEQRYSKYVNRWVAVKRWSRDDVE